MGDVENQANRKGSRPTQTWSGVFFAALGRVTTRYARTVVTLIVAISVAAVWYACRHLEFLTGRNDLISPDKRYLQLDEQYAEAFHGLGQLVVVAEGPDLEETKAFIHRLGETLAVDREQVEEVFYRIDTSSLDGKKLLLLSPDDLRTLRENVEAYQDLIHDLATSPGLNTLLTVINQQISAAMVSHLTQGFLGLEAPQEKGEQKAPLSLTFVTNPSSSRWSWRSPLPRFRTTHRGPTCLAMKPLRMTASWFPMTSALYSC